MMTIDDDILLHIFASIFCVIGAFYVCWKVAGIFAHIWEELMERVKGVQAMSERSRMIEEELLQGVKIANNLGMYMVLHIGRKQRRRKSPWVLRHRVPKIRRGIGYPRE